MIDHTFTDNKRTYETGHDAGGTVHNLPVFGVGEIAQVLKTTVEQTFQRIRVRGEVSGLKCAASGHIYFTLKDEGAVLDGVCWRGKAQSIRQQPEDGMEMIVTGRLTTYPARSRYQIIVESFELAGEGALLKLLENRRRMLGSEGLFDADRKRKLPFLPRVIGVVTSPTGAVVRDILSRLEERFPSQVLVWPVLVQGEFAAMQIVAAIQGLNQLGDLADVPKPELIIVARGGGSLEDLWAFNEETVVRAAASSEIPLISAVGHETDTTLIDFASDQRAPTPTAAAEMAVPERHKLLAHIFDDNARLQTAVNRRVKDGRLRLHAMSLGLPDLGRTVAENTQRLDDWSERLSNALRLGVGARRSQLAVHVGGLRSPAHMIGRATERLQGELRALKREASQTLKREKDRLKAGTALLESYSYQRVLERGFALVTNANGKTVASAGVVDHGDYVTLQLADGAVRARIICGGTEKKKIRERKLKSKSNIDDVQGNLL